MGRRRTAVLVGVLVLASAGCAPDTASTDPADALPPQVRVAYEGYWTEWTAAQETDDAGRLATYTSDPLLTSLTQAMREKAERDEVTRGAVARTLTSVEPMGDGYSVAACVDLDGQRDYHRGGGEVERQLWDKPLTRMTVVMREREGVWKAVNLYYDGGCDGE